MIQNTLVSIIVPVYNTADCLHECLKSIRGQSYSNIEVIIINDGSTDGSEKIVDGHAQQDKRLKVIHQQNAGVSAARNVGLKDTSGKYVTFMDGDDVIDASYIEVMTRLAEEHDAEVVKSEMASFTDGDAIPEPVMISRICKKDARHSLLDIMYCKGVGSSSGIAAKLYRTSAIKGLTFDENMTHEEDLDFLCRATENFKTIIATDYAGYFRRIRSGSAMAGGFRPGMLVSLEKRLREKGDDRGLRKAQEANIMLNSAHRMALIPSDTKKHYKEKDRLWDIVKATRRSALLNPNQRLDHKMVAASSYLGPDFMVWGIRKAKHIEMKGE